MNNWWLCQFSGGCEWWGLVDNGVELQMVMKIVVLWWDGGTGVVGMFRYWNYLDFGWDGFVEEELRLMGLSP